MIEGFCFQFHAFVFKYLLGLQSYKEIACMNAYFKYKTMNKISKIKAHRIMYVI